MTLPRLSHWLAVVLVFGLLGSLIPVQAAPEQFQTITVSGTLRHDGSPVAGVEVHLIKAGMLAAQFLLDQKKLSRDQLRSQVEDVFSSRQAELFTGRKEDIDEMRIIASWCLNRRADSRILDVLDGVSIDTLTQTIADAITDSGRERNSEQAVS